MNIENIRLETARLVLRIFTMDDLEDFYDYASVAGVGEWAGWTHHKNKEESKTILKMLISEKNNFAIVNKENNKVIGSLGIMPINQKVYSEYENKIGYELGYVLSKEYWGYGLMTEAVLEVVRFLFEDEKIDYLSCGYFVKNIRSKRVNEKIDFKFYKEYIFENRNGSFESMVYTVLERKDFLT